MKRFQLVLLIGAVFPYSSSGAESADAWPGREFQPLFNGRNLDGWRMNVGGDGRFWGADKGVLFATEGGAGYLMTELQYADFELKLEYRLPPRGTSGIAIRSPLWGDPAYDGLTIVMTLVRPPSKARARG
jgi:hypothetical protein